MRIAYFAHWDLTYETGVGKKIRDQLVTWQRLGHDVRLFVLSPGSEIWDGLRGLQVDVAWDTGFIGRFASTLPRLINRILDWQPDIVYLRFGTYYPALHRLVRKVATVLEINTHELHEYKLTQSPLKYWYHYIFRRVLLQGASGLVAVSHEIARLLSQFEKPVLVMGNGIDLARYPRTSSPANTVPTLVFIGTPGQEWHGVDRILVLAHRFPDWQFHLVGEEGSPVYPPNVTAHGHLTHEQYLHILAHADVAIGTLALFRKGMTEASALKVREYLAMGLPCILGNDDTDFILGAAPFILRLPNTPDPYTDEHYAKLEAFVRDWRGRRVESLAVAHLDTNVKERQRLAFMQEVMGGGRP